MKLLLIEAILEIWVRAMKTAVPLADTIIEFRSVM